MRGIKAAFDPLNILNPGKMFSQLEDTRDVLFRILQNRELPLQERMTAQLAAAIAEGLGADGVLVVVEAEQLCMTMREGMARGTQTVTSECLGAFRTDAALCEQAWMVLGGKKDDSNTEIRIS